MTRNVERAALPGCLDQPAIAGDGWLVGILGMSGNTPTARGDLDVVAIDPETMALQPLTRNALREEVVFGVPGQNRVAFDRRLDHWPSELDLEIYRRVVCWTDLPVRGGPTASLQ